MKLGPPLSHWSDAKLAVNGVPVCENFGRWFGDSKVVDERGEPLICFHGTASPSFTRGGTRDRFATTNGMGEGAYFTPSAAHASEYARMDAEVGDGDAAVIPVYLAIQHPALLIDGFASQSISPDRKAELVAAGHDGVFGLNAHGEVIEIVAFAPEQIKSAIGNSGLYLDTPHLCDTLPIFLREIAAQWDPAEPWLSWAGECGDFFHWVWEEGKARGLAIEGDSFDCGLTCKTVLQSPPGISLDALKRLHITDHLNHVWIVQDGRHFDAATPDGVATPWDLRCVRQALLEVMRMEQPALAAALCRDDPWWQESAELLDAFLAAVEVAEQRPRPQQQG
jgi:hypothetical protein